MNRHFKVVTGEQRRRALLGWNIQCILARLSEPWIVQRLIQIVIDGTIGGHPSIQSCSHPSLLDKCLGKGWLDVQITLRGSSWSSNLYNYHEIINFGYFFNFSFISFSSRFHQTAFMCLFDLCIKATTSNSQFPSILAAPCGQKR